MTTELAGVLTTDDTFIRPLPAPFTLGTFTEISVGSDVGNYFSETFRPSVDGVYSLEVSTATLTISNDPFLLVYENSFGPANPLTSFLIGNDDAIGGINLFSRIDNLTLTSNNQYFIVITSFHAGSTGTVTFEIVGPGGAAVGDPDFIDDSQPFFDQTSAAALANPVIFAGGTFRPSAPTTLGQPIVVQLTGGTVDANGQIVSFTGAITGAGTLAVTGAGQLVVTGTANNDGGFTVGAGGTLLVDGTISGPVVVGPTGTLGGTGTVAGPVAAAGTIAPGASPGTLTVAGPVVLAQGGALEIEIDGTGTGNGAGNYDRLVVTGAGSNFTASGTLEVVLRGIGAPADNDFTPSLGQAFAIVTAEGGILGAFASLEQPEAGLAAGTRFDAVYGANQITLYLTPASYADLPAAGLTQSANERSIGTALETLRAPAGTPAEGALGPVFDALAPLGHGQIQDALDSLGPELHADMMLAGVATRRMFGDLVFDHLAALRRDPELTGGLGPLTQMRFAFGTPPASADAIAPAAGPEPATARRAILWGQAAGGFGTTDGDDNSAGFDRQTGALMVGAEAAIIEGLIAGLGLGFGRSWVDADANLGDGTLNSYQTVLYAEAGFGASYAQASVGYGFAQYDTSRDVAVGALGQSVSGDADGHDLAVDTEVGHAFRLDPVTLELHGGLRWDRLYRESFTENDGGGLGLEVDSETLSSVRSTLGARISLPLELGQMLLRPVLSFGWRHEWADQTAKASAALGGADLEVEATEIGRDAGYVGLGLAARLAERLHLFADTEAELRKDDREAQIVLGVAFAW